MASRYIAVSQEAELQAFKVKDIDGATAIISATTTFTSLGTAIAPGVGTVVGLGVGLVVGVLSAIFGDQKKGAMNTYRVVVAEVLAQFGTENLQYRGEHESIKMNIPADPEAMLELCRESIRAIRDNFSFGSDDYQDADEAFRTVQIYNYKPCCNRTIVEFEALQDGPIESILSDNRGWIIAAGIFVAFIAK